MNEFLTSTTSSTYNDDYNRFNRYWIRSLHHETLPNKDTIIKKEKVHLFDIKDLDL